MRVYTIAEQIGTHNDHVLKVLREDCGLDVRSTSSEVSDKLADCLIYSESFKSLVLAAELQRGRVNAFAHIYRLAEDASKRSEHEIATALYETFWNGISAWGISTDETDSLVKTSKANLGE